MTRDTGRAYDALGRLRTTIRNVAGIGAQTQVQYDALDRVVLVTDPSGLNTAYSYNGFGDVLGLTSPDTGTTTSTSTYDSAGHLKTRTDARNITATYGYDLIDRVTSVTYPDSSRNLGFAYDPVPTECPSRERLHVGRVARMTDASGDTAFCYDRFGNLTRNRLTEVRDGASDALWQSYAYNATGDRTSDTSGTTRSYVYAAGSYFCLDESLQCNTRTAARVSHWPYVGPEYPHQIWCVTCR